MILDFIPLSIAHVHHFSGLMLETDAETDRLYLNNDDYNEDQ